MHLATLLAFSSHGKYNSGLISRKLNKLPPKKVRVHYHNFVVMEKGSFLYMAIGLPSDFDF